MYAAAARAQLRPEPGTPGASGLGNFATLQANEKQKSETQRPDSREQDKYGIEVEESLKRDMREDDDGEEVVPQAHLP